MKMMLGAAATGLLVLMTIGGGIAAAGGPHDKGCVNEVRIAGDWGKNVNPGKATFVSGTEGNDMIDTIDAGVVFCGLGGHDHVVVNNGWFYGGDGIDSIEVNNGIVDGGEETDVVFTNNGVFNGKNDRDAVLVNNGVFNGGPGSDVVQNENNGTCIDVEQGC